MLGRMIDDADLDDAVLIARIKLFDELRVAGLAQNWNALKLSLIKQCRIEWIIDFIPGGYIADGLAVFIYAAAFEIAKIADVMRRPVTARPGQACLSGF